jgi:hypothetical protein
LVRIVTDKLTYNAREAAAAVGVSERSIWAAIADGRLKTCKAFGRTLITTTSLKALLGVEETSPQPAHDPIPIETAPTPPSGRGVSRGRRRANMQLPFRPQ